MVATWWLHGGYTENQHGPTQEDRSDRPHPRARPAEEMEDDDEAFAEKMQKLTEKLGEQMAKGAELDALIRQKLGRLGYEF